MAKGSRLRPTRHAPPPGWKNPLDPQQPLTTLRWLAAAFAATLLLAVFCVYVAFCLLFWQGQWQLVFKPSRSVANTPASAGLTFKEVEFDATEAGVLQLHGWWLPAAIPNTGTLLLMHDGNGSLSETVAQLQALHPLNMDVFVFDYRGFGQSLDLHPSEASTYQDADAAWHYLTETRHIAAGNIVLDGVGLGAAIAAEIARRHPETRAVILEQPRPPVLDTLRFNPQTRLLPVRLLFHDRFDPRPTLAHLLTPKLFVAVSRNEADLYYQNAAGPKAKAILPAGHDDRDYPLCLRNFLSQYPTRP